jgi:hypothetical protein
MQPISEVFMSTTVEAVIDKDGIVRLLEHVPLAGSREVPQIPFAIVAALISHGFATANVG